MPKELKVQIQSEGPKPLCPYCEKELTEVIDYRSGMPKQHFLLNLHMFACPHCRKVLGTDLCLK